VPINDAGETAVTRKQNHTIMNYIITGSLGHVAKPLASQLIDAGHAVTVVSSSPGRKAQIESMGAAAAIGSVEDTGFLTRTFKGADAVFTMVPPGYSGNDWKGHIARIGMNYARAISDAGVTHVVNLSSVGAHLLDSCGPVSGLHRVEHTLNSVDGLHVRHLRAGFFYTNFLAGMELVKQNGFLSGNYGEHTRMVLVHPEDIADAAARELQEKSSLGRGFRYIASDEKTTDEIAAILGKAAGIEGLRWVDRTDGELLEEMIGRGMPEEIAKNYTEMGAAIRDGSMNSHYFEHRPVLSGWRRLESFAPYFAAVYASGT